MFRAIPSDISNSDVAQQAGYSLYTMSFLILLTFCLDLANGSVFFRGQSEGVQGLSLPAFFACQMTDDHLKSVEYSVRVNSEIVLTFKADLIPYKFEQFEGSLMLNIDEADGLQSDFGEEFSLNIAMRVIEGQIQLSVNGSGSEGGYIDIDENKFFIDDIIVYSTEERWVAKIEQFEAEFASADSLQDSSKAFSAFFEESLYDACVEEPDDSPSKDNRAGKHSAKTPKKKNKKSKKTSQSSKKSSKAASEDDHAILDAAIALAKGEKAEPVVFQQKAQFIKRRPQKTLSANPIKLTENLLNVPFGPHIPGVLREKSLLSGFILSASYPSQTIALINPGRVDIFDSDLLQALCFVDLSQKILSLTISISNEVIGGSLDVSIINMKYEERVDLLESEQSELRFSRDPAHYRASFRPSDGSPPTSTDIYIRASLDNELLIVIPIPPGFILMIFAIKEVL